MNFVLLLKCLYTYIIVGYQNNVYKIIVKTLQQN